MKRPQFGFSEEAISGAYRYVLAETTIPEDMREVMFPAYLYALWSGNPRLEPRALALLMNIKWDWPLFDEWQAHFTHTGQWPYMWKKVDFPTLIKGHSSYRIREAKIELLSHMLVSISAVLNRFEGQVAFVRKRGWKLAGAGCSVEDAIAIKAAKHINLDDWRTWPPFFPGDRTILLADLSSKAKPK